MTVALIVGLIKKDMAKRESLGIKVKVELDLSNYVTKSGLKDATGIDTSNFAKKVDLASLKSEVDRLDIVTLEKVQIGLNSLKSKVDN